QVVLGELAMLNQHQYMTLLNPGWALIHILRISLIFPLIFFALRARPLTTLAATIALSVAANWAQAQPNAPFWMKEVGGGAQYLASFALGGWIFLARESIARVVAPLWMKLALTAGAIGFFLAPRQWPGTDIWFPSIGAALGMMALLASPSAHRVFSTPVLLWLGGISFSLYLVHVVVLLTVLHLLYGTTPAIVLIAIIVA